MSTRKSEPSRIRPDRICKGSTIGRRLTHHKRKVYLDDERVAPEGWHQVLWPDEVIAQLKTGLVTHLSLDHDLGDDERGTGYDVILWLEREVALAGMAPPHLAVHSANSSARIKMEAGIKSILRLAKGR